MRALKRCMALVAAAALAATASLVAAPGEGVRFVLPYWPMEERSGYEAREQEIVALASADRLRAWHDLIASEPHIAGTPGDARQVERLATAMQEMGLEVEVHEFWAYLSRPIAAEVEVVAPERITLPVREVPPAEDPFMHNPGHWPGFAAYSGSGEAESEVVYANYGRKEDFQALAERGVDCSGKVVICRYGGNYRGFKARYAQAAGAAALLVYTDPADSGYVRGVEYPEGGFAGPGHIQRGSYQTMAYPGDPLTPGIEATEDAPRVPLSAVEAQLPRIPVQPIGYGAAAEILERMRGDKAPAGWQGGLPTTYRLTGGTGLRVRVKVEQEREIVQCANVIGRLVGEREPDRWVIVGAHHDAWGCGAGDPTSGTICMLEAARTLSEAARKGARPARSILFCAWGAEEWGIIGSTEWVEGRREELMEKAVAYVNLDAATMGPDFGAAASPSLKRLIVEASRSVPQARNPFKTVYEAWIARGSSADAPDEPVIGDLGGGSDHIGFCCHLAVPSVALSAGGAEGTAYHGMADTLAWYRKVVGEDYEPALMVTRMTIAVVSRLANAPVLPLDPARVCIEFRRHLRALTSRAVANGAPLTTPGSGVADEFAAVEGLSRVTESRVRRAAEVWLGAAASGSLDPEDRTSVNEWLMSVERLWYGNSSPGREWYRSLLVATDETSGYESWMLPRLRHAVDNPEHYEWRMGPGRDKPSLGDLIAEYERVFEATVKGAEEVTDALGDASPGT